MAVTSDSVMAWAETVRIPTYGVAQPDKNPMFLEKRVYQGSSGSVYPHPVIDRVFDEKQDKAYTALFLENRYLKIIILPELGGRLQMAQDKTNGYQFVYYNRVIKPALVGLTGPWISGGIEFNWPQHHRPSTFSPVEWQIVANNDGSKTVWCSEIERMSFTKGMHGFTLHPARATVEISVQLVNRTSEPQTFLWWANPAVAVNDDYQSVFPPDVHAVMDHGKRDVSDFPIATGTYYKVNYAPGTDISRYTNIPAPTSYMAYHSDFDFVGDYDHGQRAGMMHVADHHVVPGKKQWTWGNGDFGRAWDRQLTDEDGPYIELMCGAFTDNQPDFSWLMPGEEKRFTQTFLPYKLIGPAKNAARDAVVNLEFDGGRVTIGVYLTSPRDVTVTLCRGDAVVWTTTGTLSPEQVLLEAIELPDETEPQEVTLRVIDVPSGRCLVTFTPLPNDREPIPAPASAAKPPAALQSNEELFLNGLHLEQYRHATYAPEPYYEEALRRDPYDSRCHNALGLLLYRRGVFTEAEGFFRRAIASLTRRNPNPYDGEPFYNLGLALKMQGRYREAFDAFYKAVWNAAWQDSGYFELARLATRFGDREQALAFTDNALRRNWSHQQCRHLKIALLRHGGRTPEALVEVTRALELDIFDWGALRERDLLTGEAAFGGLARGSTEPYVAVALDYMHAGLYADAVHLLQAVPEPDPMVLYFVGYCHLQQGMRDQAEASFRRAAAGSPDYCFPNRLESVPALVAAIAFDPGDASAAYYLGTFWYAHRRFAEAIGQWERARDLNPSFATTHRNLGLAYFNKLGEPERALESYERAFAANQGDARVLFELDQLTKKLQYEPATRLLRLERHLDLVGRRDDLSLEYVTLLNIAGRYEDAYHILTRRRFHPWEGGEGKTVEQYVISLVEQARSLMAETQFGAARELLERALVYPENLGEGKLPNAPENNVRFYLGLAHAGLGEQAAARASLEQAATGLAEPSSALYYNDQPPEMVLYRALASRELGRVAEAQQIFQRLVAYGRAHLDDDVQMDYFAVSLPTFLVFDEDLQRRNRIHCHFMMALGYAGLGNGVEAEQQFRQVLALDANHQGALMQRKLTQDVSA